MSIEFFGTKCLQRRHPDVLCKRVTLAIPSISSLRVTPHQVLQPFHCSLQPNTARPGERMYLSNPLALTVVRRSRRSGRRRQASPSPDPQPTRMSNDIHATRVHQQCVHLICQHSQGVQRHHDFNRCVCFRHRCGLSFHGPRQYISRFRMYAHDEVLCASCPRHEFTSPFSSVAEAYQGLSCPPRLDWLVLDS